MTERFPTYVLVAVFLAVATAAHGSPLEDCNSDEATRIFAGCTTLIEKKMLSGEDLAIAYSRRSDVHAAQSNWDDALADRQSALDLAPSDEGLRARLAHAAASRGMVHLEAREIDGAISDFSKAVTLAPRQAAYRETLAGLHELQGHAHLADKRYEDAVSAFSRAFELGRDGPEIRLKRGRAFAGAGQYGKAIADYSKAIELDPADSTAHRERGRLYLQQGLDRKAVEDFSSVLARTPDDIEILLLRALALEPQLATDRASDDYRRVLEIDPRNKAARAGLTRVREARTAAVKLVQLELKRIGCNPGAVDGDWGRRSRSALVAVERHTSQSGLADLHPDSTLLALLRNIPTIPRGKCRVKLLDFPKTPRDDVIPPAVSAKPCGGDRIRNAKGECAPKKATVKPRPSKRKKSTVRKRPDPSRYSGKVWRFGSVPTGMRVSHDTKFGRLTCIGSTMGRKRKCWWN